MRRQPKLLTRSIAVMAFIAGGSTVSSAQENALVSIDPAVNSAEKVLVTVEGEKITQGDVEERFQARMGGQTAQMPAEQKAAILSQAQDQIEDQLVTEVLLGKAVDEAKLEVTDAEVEKVYEEFKGQVPPGTDFDENLIAMGMTEETLRKDIRKNLKIKKLLDAKTDSVEKPKEEEISKFYNDNPQYFEQPETAKARHILIQTSETDTEEVLKEKKGKIDAIRTRLVGEKAEDFAAVAKETSEGPSSTDGGSLGEFGRGQMVPEFEQAVFSQEIGVISEPVKTQFGYHLIKVEEKNEGKKIPLDEVKDKISESLYEQKKGEVIEKYIGELKAVAKIEKA